MSGTDVRMSRNVLFIAPAKRHLYNGEWLTALELSERTGIPRPTIYARLRRGQPFDVPGKPGRQPKQYLFRGQRLTVPEIANMTGRDRTTVYDRICGDRVLDDAELHNPEFVREPPSHAKFITHKGKTLCMGQWARLLGMNKQTLRSRLIQGWSMDRIVSEPVTPASLRGRRLRNYRKIARIRMAFRRDRNQRLIRRMSAEFCSAVEAHP